MGFRCVFLIRVFTKTSFFCGSFLSRRLVYSCCVTMRSRRAGLICTDPGLLCLRRLLRRRRSLSSIPRRSSAAFMIGFGTCLACHRRGLS